MTAIPRLRPRILEKYLAVEVIKLSVLSLAAFLAIFLVVDFFERIDRLMRAGLGLQDLGIYLLLKTPFALGQVLPAAFFLGVMLALGLLARAHETMAMKASGVDILRLTRPVFAISGVAALVLLGLNLYIIPWSQGRLNLFWDTHVHQKPPRSLMGLEHFWYKGDQAIYNIVLFRKDIQTLEGVKIYFFDRKFRLTQVIIAKRAQWRENHWHFYDGFIQNLDVAGEEAGEKFLERELKLTERPEDFSALEKKISEMDIAELSQYINRLERDGYKSTSYRLEFQNRISLSVTPVVLTLLGLGLILRRENAFLPPVVAVGLGLMFAYWLVFGFCASLGQAERWPVLGAAWLPHGGFALMGVALLRQANR